MRHCTICKKPERTDGILSTLTPYSRICVDCINRILRKRG